MTEPRTAYGHRQLRVELDALRAAATPGPWRYNPAKEWHTDLEKLALARRGIPVQGGEEFVAAGSSGAPICVAVTGPSDDPRSMADAALITAAVNVLLAWLHDDPKDP